MKAFLVLTVGILSLVTVGASDLDTLAGLLLNPVSHSFGLRDDQGASMDCLQTFQIPNSVLTLGESDNFYGVYHSYNSSNDYWNIFLAESLSGPQGPWRRIQLLVSKSGSMPFMYYHTETGYLILAYEFMSSSGNYPKLLFYQNLNALLSSDITFQTTLMKRIHVPTQPNTYTNDVSSDIVNVGTPSITEAHYIDNSWVIYLRFHFTTTGAPEYDMPGFGVVTCKPSMEVNGEYFNWQAYFDNDANNAIEIARQVQGGKIGQRANIRYRGKLYYLYEAQLNRNFDWSNWRLFLYSPSENRAVQLALSIDGIVDFANPSVTQYPNKTVVSLFVPSQAINPGTPVSDKPGCLVLTLPAI